MYLKRAFLCPYCGGMYEEVCEYGSGEFYRNVELNLDGSLDYDDYEVYLIGKTWVSLPCGDEYEVLSAKELVVSYLEFTDITVIYKYSEFVRLRSFSELGYFWCVR